ncbi:glycosyltransferase family 4 protein [Oceanicoccus sp. KOV_DT_Chl]|uniref:glycosyltransferase family 4 protein n=1 Tax=Oceanicoccus sp. KOV_DT_Chl TaxID=1904639 RepID=UPI0011AF5E45|nr:glycosyltransferase family 4 protein [Oceanicoccus sp. KOV_DT_Chl]
MEKSKRKIGSVSIVEMTTTYPLSPEDCQPDFIQSLCLRLAENINVNVLAPSSSLMNKHVDTDVGLVKVVYYRYFFKGLEQLCYGAGINANIKEKPWRLLLVPLLLAGQLLALSKMTRNSNIDLLHAHWIIPQGLVAVIYKKIFKAKEKILITAHGGDLYSLKSNLLVKLKCWVLNNADHITVVSSPMQSYCINQLGIEANKLSVLPMGVDIAGRFSIKQPVLRASNAMIFVGRLVDKKGVATLLKALAELGRDDWSLKIIGDGPLMPLLVDLCRKLNLDTKVEFLGAVHNTLIADYLYAADIAVMPFEIANDGDQEGLGLTTVEAMACGCAVVVADLPVVADVVTDGVDGLLFQSSNQASLRQTLNRLLADQDLKARLQAASRASVLARFDWQTIGNQYADLIENMCRK